MIYPATEGLLGTRRRKSLSATQRTVSIFVVLHGILIFNLVLVLSAGLEFWNLSSVIIWVLCKEGFVPRVYSKVQDSLEQMKLYRYSTVQ
jgi:hypothetical protein